MSDWFTVEQIEADTYVISEPKHWEETHCYLLCGSERAILIDTGLGVENIREIVGRLTNLPIVVILTHAHWDHIGGLGQFKTFAVHEAEASWLKNFPLPLSAVRRSLAGKPCDFPPRFDVRSYRIFHGKPQRLLHDGDRLELGNRTLSVLHTPGHSPGHCCFFEEVRGNLFTGDLIYSGCLDAFYPTTDPVAFWHSVQRVQRLNVRRILPGHHGMRLLPDFIGHIEAAFSGLARKGRLHHGSGCYDFGDFRIRL